jgi:hypothetical protein
MLGRRTAPLLLLSRADVRDDLSLTAEQIAGADRAIASLYARAAATKGMKGGQIEADRKAIDKAQAAWTRDHLTPAQHTRLLQIDLQWEGPSALVSRPIVADSLALSVEQRKALEDAVAARDAARRAAGVSLEAEKALAERALLVLDERQRERWRAILGRPFAPRLAAAAPAGETASK